MSSLRRKKKIIQLSFVIVCLSVTAILVFCQIKEDTEDDTLKNIRVESIDKAIKISWKASLLTAIKTVVIETINSNNEICEVADVRPFWLSYEFKDGDIGERYHITVTAVYKDGRREELASEYRLLLDTDELPDLPTLYITTNSGNNPSTNHIDAPEGMWGSASVDNNAETGILVYKLKKSENKSIESRIRIAVRGNTSSIGEKEPYKIILDRAIDLIGTDDSSAHKEWLLLKSGTTLNNYVEQSLSEYCGMEWISQGTFVNVYLNGDWRGLYTLAEPVSQEASHDLVGKNGCIIENDAYWWNSNGIYFRLDGQIEQMAYTFKYPSIKSVEDDRFKNVKYFMQNLVDMSDDNDYNVWDFADIETFVAWLMVHDMVQCGDGGGTNIYYYINDFSAVEEEKQKIKMGPVWDCDAAFATRTFSDKHAFSAQHYANVFPFVNNTNFMDRYCEKWNELSGDIVSVMCGSFEELYKEDGAAINQSRMLDMKRWDTEPDYLLVEDEMNVIKGWLKDQIEFLDSLWGE